MRLQALTVMFLSCVFAAPAGAEICRWKDAAGRTQYSDSPPPGVKCEGTVRKPPPAAAGAAGGGAAAPQSYQEKEMEFRKRRQEKIDAELKAQQEKEKDSVKRTNCENAKARLAGLQRGGRITRYDASGQISYLSDEEIAKETADARKVVDQACK